MAVAAPQTLSLLQYLHRPGVEHEDAQQMPSLEPGPAEVAPSVPDMQSEDEPANLGQWSPAPLEPEEYAGRDVEPEEDDLRTLNLLRTQVRLSSVSSTSLRAPISMAGSDIIVPSERMSLKGCGQAAKPTSLLSWISASGHVEAWAKYVAVRDAHKASIRPLPRCWSAASSWHKR